MSCCRDWILLISSDESCFFILANLAGYELQTLFSPQFQAQFSSDLLPLGEVFWVLLCACMVQASARHEGRQSLGIPFMALFLPSFFFSLVTLVSLDWVSDTLGQNNCNFPTHSWCSVFANWASPQAVREAGHWSSYSLMQSSHRNLLFFTLLCLRVAASCICLYFIYRLWGVYSAYSVWIM